MPPIDLDEFREEIDQERLWREAELRFVRQIALNSDDDSAESYASRIHVVMLYSHLEGACKAILSIYVNYLNKLGLQAGDAHPALYVASLSSLFKALRNTSAKPGLVAPRYPKDPKLHQFARELEFIESLPVAQSPVVRLDSEVLVDTESNIDALVIRKILYSLGLRVNLADQWSYNLGRLKYRRNEVAHGKGIVINDKQMRDLEAGAQAVLDELVDEVTRALRDKAYLAVP